MSASRFAMGVFAVVPLLIVCVPGRAGAQTALDYTGNGIAGYAPPAGGGTAQYASSPSGNLGRAAFGGASYYGSDGFVFDDPLLSAASGVFHLTVYGDPFLTTTLGTVEGTVAGGGFASDVYTATLVPTRETGVFADVFGTGTLSVSGLPPSGSGFGANGFYTATYHLGPGRGAAAVPEAGTLALVGLGIVPLVVAARRRRRGEGE